MKKNVVVTGMGVVSPVGDNLADFDSVFYKKSNKERIQSVDSLSKMFGDKFIVFPNLIYGDWEDGFKNQNLYLVNMQRY